MPRLAYGVLRQTTACIPSKPASKSESAPSSGRPRRCTLRKDAEVGAIHRAAHAPLETKRLIRRKTSISRTQLARTLLRRAAAGGVGLNRRRASAPDGRPPQLSDDPRDGLAERQMGRNLEASPAVSAPLKELKAALRAPVARPSQFAHQPMEANSRRERAIDQRSPILEDDPRDKLRDRPTHRIPNALRAPAGTFSQSVFQTGARPAVSDLAPTDRRANPGAPPSRGDLLRLSESRLVHP
jgi:hypothetical protein